MDTVGMNQYPEGFETLVELARELSSQKSPDELWSAIQDEWRELQEVVAKMQQQTDRIQRTKLLPLYLDELADVWWNFAKYVAFSPESMNDIQGAFFESLQSMKMFGCDIVDRARKKFEERYASLKGFATRTERDEQWEKTKKIQQDRLKQESVQVGVQTILRLNTGKRVAEFGTLDDIRGNASTQVVLVNKGLSKFVFSAISAMTCLSESEVKQRMNRKDYCILRGGESVFLIQIVKGPESVRALIELYPAMPMVFVGGTDVVRKLEETNGCAVERFRETSGMLFWGKSEILCLADSQSVSRMLQGVVPTQIITRETPYLTEMAVRKSGMSNVQIVSTDSNVEGNLVLSTCINDDTVVSIGTEIVETGSSVLANDLSLLYWDESRQQVIVYDSCVRGGDGKFPEDKIIAVISADDNSQIVEFVRTFQTSLDVCVAQVQSTLQESGRASSSTRVVADMVEVFTSSSVSR